MRGDSTAPNADEQRVPDRAERTRGPRRALVEAEILDEAARLFATRGFAATSMQEIATALGTSRPALYHYFTGKDEILTRLVQGLADDSRRALDQAAAVRGGAEERLAGLVCALAAPIAAAPLRARLIRSSLIELLDLDGQFAAVRDEVLLAVSGVIDEGCESGEFRRCDGRVVAFSILGMINWLAWWYDPATGPSPEALTGELSEAALAMVRAQTADHGPVGVSGAIAAMRRDLDFLERTVCGDGSVTKS
ncbi:TetR/AcrR family transcriptional regulator [Catenulispora sp. NF23]|uniref:TetR/AcrR family transcriptional regulator n=1 Tax=Catenulispora pinistramenti TaxID=2705254 RepID=UPI001BA9CE80|nr:TetR/AcrR family transcriptional regulator [Catenulispora pinistramenti]MBS2533604.1 TetR/AcrR family transcriptional regulator [Catenulispora pinistramenti]